MSKSKIDILIEVNARTNELLEAQRRVGELRTKLLSMGKMGAAFLGVQVGIQGIGAALKSAAAAAVGFNATLEQQTQALKTLMGSADGARARMAELVRFSAQTPFSLEEVVQANRLLQTFGGAALATNDALRLVGDAAAASGRGFSEVAMWIGRLYSGLQAGQPVGEATLRLLEMGVVSAGAKARIEALSGSSMSAASAMSVLQESFGATSGAMEEQAGTFNGLMSTFRDGLRIIYASAAEPVFQDMKDALAGLVEGLEGGGGKLRVFGQMLRDVFRAAVSLAGALAAAGPYIGLFVGLLAATKVAAFAQRLYSMAAGALAARSALQSVQLVSWTATLQRTTFAVTAAAGALAKMRAGVLAVGASMRAAFLANPIGIIATAVTAIVAGLWVWRARQRDISRELRASHDELRRMQEAWPARMAAVEDEAGQTALVRDLNEEINLLIKQRSDGGLNAAEERRLAALRQQVKQAQALTEADRIRNREAAEYRRELEAALRSAPESLAKLTAGQPDLRGERDALQARLSRIPEIDPAALETERNDLLQRIEALRVPESELPDWMLSQAEQETQYAREQDAGALREYMEAKIAANALKIAQQRERMELVERLAAIDAQLAEEAKERAAQEAAWRAEADRLTIEGIRQQEAALRQSFEAQGGDARAHYAQLTAYAAQRWDKEIAAAQEAADSAVSDAEKEVAALALANAERGKVIELQDIEIERNQALERAAREHYDAEMERVRGLVRAADEALLDASDVEERTQLESTRAKLVERALAAFNRYKAAVEGLGLPEGGLAGPPDVGDAPERGTRFERTSEAYGKRGSADQSYQGIGEALTGGVMEAQMQMGTLWNNIADGVANVANAMRESIGGAIEGLITRTMTFGQAARSIAVGFGQSMIKAIADIGARWVVEQGLMLAKHIAFKGKQFAVDALFAAKGLALNMAMAAKSLVAWIPSAIAASISSFGLAGTIGLAAVVALLGSKMFDVGGYTEPGAASKPAGVVHAGEWVAPQWQVKHPVFGPMIAQLEQARIGRATVNYTTPTAGYAVGGPVAIPLPLPRESSAAAAHKFNIGVFMDQRALARWAQTSEGESAIMDVFKRNRYEMVS